MLPAVTIVFGCTILFIYQIIRKKLKNKGKVEDNVIDPGNVMCHGPLCTMTSSLLLIILATTTCWELGALEWSTRVNLAPVW
jgi:hypothetical protein